MSEANLTKVAGVILPELNERTLTIEGKALRIYNNDGEIRWEAWEAFTLMDSRAKHLAKTAKELKAKILEDLKAGVKVAPGNHTIALGKKKNTSASWKGYTVELLDCTPAEAEAAIKETEHYKSEEVDCLVIDGKIV